MAEYITKEQAYNSVDERIDELRADKEFNIVKEICISGVKKHIETVPTADVVEREKIDKAIKDIKNIDLIVHDGINHYYKSGEEVKAEVLVILKRNIRKRWKNE